MANQVIDNTNLLNMCRDCGAVGFVPIVDYTYADGVVTVNNSSTIPADDVLVKVKIKVHDMFGGTVSGEILAADDPSQEILDVSDLNLSKPLSLSVTIITDDGIIADGGAYGLLADGDVANWDVQKNAANEY